MALNKFRPPDAPYTATPTPMYLHRGVTPRAYAPPRMGAPAVIPQSTQASGIDPNSLPPEIQAQLQALYPSAPQMQQSPNGPFGVSGNALDQASLGALQGFQNMTAQPRNAGQSIVGGLVQGLAAGRASQAMGRAQANQTAAAEYQKQLDAYKTAASEAGKALAQHRYRMIENAAQQAGKPSTGTEVDVTDRPDLQALIKKRGAGLPSANAQGRVMVPAAWVGPTTAAEKPPVTPDEGDFAGNVEHNVDGVPYLNISKWGGKDRNAAMHFAVANGMRALMGPEADGIKEIDNAKLNTGTMGARIENLLPQDWQQRIQQYPGIKMSALLQSNENRAAFGDMRVAAIQQIRALVTKGLRMNMAEINLAVNNDIPQLADTYPTAMRRINDLNDFFTNAANSVLVKDRSQLKPSTKANATGNDNGKKFLGKTP